MATGSPMMNQWLEPHARKNARKTMIADYITPDSLLPVVDLAHHDREGSNQYERLFPCHSLQSWPHGALAAQLGRSKARGVREDYVRGVGLDTMSSRRNTV